MCDVLKTLQEVNERYKEEVQKKISEPHSRKLLKAMLDKLAKTKPTSEIM